MAKNKIFCKYVVCEIYVCIEKCEEIIHLNCVLIYQLNMLFTFEYF